MRSTFISLCNYIIEYSFYAIVLTVPFAFTDKTFELFEFNKMWLLFGYTIVIGATWICKMIAQKRVFVQKTLLDIPIGLFLLAHIISTLFSMDQHLSIWGYYSRFNGGLLSMLTYILLYYAFVTNVWYAKHSDEHIHPADIHLPDAQVFTKRILKMSVWAATFVALWGLPAHFGYDPTCLIFRGTFDVSCWTADFQPKIRIFSTLGQPNWLATYLAILMPVSLAFAFNLLDTYGKKITKHTKAFITMLIYFAISILFYADIIYTNSQSGFIGAAIGIGIFILGYFVLHYKTAHLKQAINYLSATVVILAITTFFVGIPVLQLKQFTFYELQKRFTPAAPASVAPTKQEAPKPTGSALEGGGGTDSSTIRKYVWQGAIDAWKANPLFGTGVETFAFAYYKYRPAGHNMTSEWDFLYNKAHNEYLNYLATTGAFGLLSYLAMIVMFLSFALQKFLKMTKNSENTNALIILSLVAGYVSMLISNFFGFSVVTGNLYLFLIPAFVFILGQMIVPHIGVLNSKQHETTAKSHYESLGAFQWTSIIVILCIAGYMEITLISYWMADTAFALANNLDRVGEYNQGYKEIRNALALRQDEPTFKEELANSDATIAVALINQKQTEPGIQLAKEAMQTINDLVTEYPNNINFLKSQVRVYYSLGQLNPAYYAQALEAMQKAHALAPTDAKISYNLGVLYGQTGQTQKGIEVLNETIQLKPDYMDAYFALGLFYHDLAVDKNGKVIHPDMQQKAIDEMNYMLSLSPNNKQVLDTLKSWGVEK